MSRIRSIKPEFWTSAQLLECSRDARLLFIGLWNFCDDTGRHVDSAKQIKAEIFPADDLLVENVRGMLDELSANGLIKLYRSGGQALLQVTGWRHQRIDKKQAPRYPGPDDSGSGTDSENVPRTLPPDPIRSDPIGREGIGITHTARAREAEPVGRIADEAEHHVMFERIRKAYPPFAGRQNWIQAEHFCRIRLEQGSTWNELHDAVKRYAKYADSGGVSSNAHILSPVTFFSAADEPWKQPWEPPTAKPRAAIARPKFVPPPDEPEAAIA